MVPFASNHFWGRVARAATCSLQLFAFFVKVRQPEINELHIVIVVQQQILWFQVSVDDAQFVDVLNS